MPAPDQAVLARWQTAGGRFSDGYEKFQTDPHFKDHILFHEYFHGDNGRGCGASHQTGWTGLVANLISQLAQTPTASAASARPTTAKPVSPAPVHP